MAANPAEVEPTSLDYLRDVEKNQSKRNVATVFTGIFAVGTTILASKANITSDQGIVVGLSAFLTAMGATGIKFAQDEVSRLTGLMKNKMAAEQQELREIRASDDLNQQLYEGYAQSYDSAMM